MNSQSNTAIKTVNLDPNSNFVQVDYLKCFICQSSKKKKANTKIEEALIHPTQQGFASICRDFARFIACKNDSVPCHIESLFRNSNQFEELLTKNNAVLHKQCRDEYNEQKLQRLEKRCKKIQIEETACDLSDISSMTASSTQIVLPNFDQCYESVFQEIVKLIESSRSSSELPFYKLSQLAKTMSERLDQLGFEKVTIHTSRLKDELLLSIPGFRADKIGRDVILSFDENVKHLVSGAIKNEVNTKEDIYQKASDLLRETYTNESVFSGSLNKNFCAEKTVSKELVSFVSSLMGGDTADSKISENIAQLIQFNSVKNRKAEASYVRHNHTREQPLPIYIALLIHSLSGKRSLIDELFEMGLCVSYSRVLDIERALATKVCDIYAKDDCVCPPHLKLGVFTTAAVDNIDHNPRSNSANYSFHGTGISLIQHYDQPNNNDYQQVIDLQKADFSNRSKPSLPKSYYEIQSIPSIAGEVPVPTVNWECSLSSNKPLEYVKNWLEANKHAMNEDLKSETISWSAYNSRACVDTSKYKSTSVMLPLIKDSVNSPAVVRHTMDLIISTTKKINPTQIPVWTGDQPVYAIAKQLQWLYPEKYGEDKIVVMLGGLHIEKSFLAVIGTWLEGSGWEDALVKAGVTTSGRAEGILRSDHIKKARYAHEVSLVALSILLYEQFETDPDREDNDYYQWIETKRQQSPQFQFWITTMELEAILLQFVKSLRTGDFDEYVLSLESMSPWYLVTDHTHYGRWMPVFGASMRRLPTTSPETYAQFKNGHFTSRQTDRKFSCISDDHLHEQNNKLVKESSSLLGMLNDESALIKWMVSGPEISRLIWEYKNTTSKAQDFRHHEDSKWFQSKFGKDVQNLVKVWRSKGPFSTTELATIGPERKLMNEDSTKSVMSASQLGLAKYDDYVLHRLIRTDESIHLTIKQSQLKIFKVKTEKKVNKDKMKLAAANMDSNLFCKMFIACGARKGNVSEFFMHENSRYPPSLSEFGSLRQTAMNDDFVNCLSKSNKIDRSSRLEFNSAAAQSNVGQITASAFIMNAFTHVQRTHPSGTMNVKDYSDKIFDRVIDSKRENYDRVDVLFDVNQEKSLEEMTKEHSSEEKYTTWIENETKLQSGKAWFSKFLGKSKNKTQFLKLLASNYIQNTPRQNDYIYGTEEHIVISPKELTHISVRLPIENINTRMLLHVEDAVRKGHQQILLSTSDINIVIIAIYSFKYLLPHIQKMWVEVVDDKNSRVIPIHELYEMHKDKSDVLPFFNAFTGCSTTSSFFGIGKITAWNAWMNFPSVTSAMLRLVTDRSPNLSNEAMDVLEEFTVKMYDSSSKMKSLHECRRELFTRKVKPRTIDRIPPTRDALEQHIKRCMLQFNIWTQCLQKNIQQHEPTDWGWVKDEKSIKYTPLWTSIPIIADHCKELISCKCAKKCTGRCKCVKNGLPCTMLCVCDGKCGSELSPESTVNGALEAIMPKELPM